MADIQHVKVEFNYNPELDILTVDKEDREPEEYEESLPIGDYIIDLNAAEEVIGLEILNASMNLPFEKEELENIENIEMAVKEIKNTRTISVELKYAENKGKFSFGYETAQA